MTLNSSKMTMSLSQAKVKKVRDLCHNMLASNQVLIRELSQLIGTLNSTVAAILPAPLHYRQLQLLRSQALRQAVSYQTMVTLPPACKTELRWWLAHLEEMNGKHICIPAPDIVMDSDASRTGWGATCQGRSIKGFWKEEERAEHINALELRAVFLGIKGLINVSEAHILIRSDNKTTVAHINKMGGTKSAHLVSITKLLWEYCLNHKLLITAGVSPGEGELMRRQAITGTARFQRLETGHWGVLSDIQEMGPMHAGSVRQQMEHPTPSLCQLESRPRSDLSGRFSGQVERGITVRFSPILPDQSLSCQDVAGQGGIDFNHTNLAHPGVVRNDPRATDRESDPAALVRRTAAVADGGGTPAAENREPPLSGLEISASACARRAFLKTLPTSCPAPDGRALRQLTTAPGQNGMAGVSHGKLIRFMPLWSS